MEAFPALAGQAVLISVISGPIPRFSGTGCEIRGQISGGNTENTERYNKF
ncbi:MAG: hypothetical protein ABFS35_21360 [Bacteroidota bacterium]